MKSVFLVCCIGALALCHGVDLQLDLSYSSTNEVENFNFYTFDAYRKVFDESKNFVFSPLSLRVIYNMLFQSAIGDSEKSLKSLLFHESNFDLKQKIIDGQSENLNAIWNSPNVLLANKLYLRDGAELSESFSALVTKYKSEFETVDFSKGGEIATLMNNWVENKTNGLIQNLVAADSVDATAQLFAINTLYFKADWSVPYEKKHVKTDVFHCADGTNSDTEFIYQSDFYSFAQFDDLKVDVLEIPYELESGFVFWIILPRQDSNLVALSSQLNNVFFEKVGKTLTQAYLQIKFPTFTIESDVDGKKISPDVFGKSEFQILKDAGTLAVDEIKQKAKIIVNTKGTEASAATYAKLMLLSAVEVKETKEFTADRPFVFAVVSKSLNQPIFVGHYVKP